MNVWNFGLFVWEPVPVERLPCSWVNNFVVIPRSPLFVGVLVVEEPANKIKKHRGLTSNNLEAMPIVSWDSHYLKFLTTADYFGQLPIGLRFCLVVVCTDPQSTS